MVLSFARESVFPSFFTVSINVNHITAVRHSNRKDSAAHKMAARPFPPSLGATYWTAGDGQWSPEPSANEVVSPANWQPSIDGRSHTQVASEDVLAADLSALPSVLSASQPSYAPLPTEAEQRALATLKDYPDYVLVAWFNSARRWPAGQIFSRD